MTPYPHYPERHTRYLDGLWELARLGPDADFDTVDPRSAVFDDYAEVPGVFDMSADHYGVRELVLYRKTITGFPAGKSRIRIEGLGLFGKVFFDGKKIGGCETAYCSYAFDFICSSKKTHEIVIAVDNRFWDRKHSVLFDGFADFYGFGGIYRSVILQHLPDTFIDRVRVVTLDRTTGKVRLDVLTGGRKTDTITFRAAFDTNPSETYTVPVKNGTASLTTEVPGFRLWSPEHPNLHLLTVETDDDKIVERFGIRTIETRGHDILLNGEKIYLQGFNRHESHPESGPVTNPSRIVNDLKWLRLSGANYIRTVHYQQDPMLLDLCDETGFLVWEETIGWGFYGPEVNEKFPRIRDANRAMIRRGINNPCIIIWSFLNEGGNNREDTEDTYVKLVADIRKEDPTRLVSYCCWQPNTREKCMEAIDIISRHLYPGWIGAPGAFGREKSSAFIRPALKEIVKWADSDPAARNKPLIISEIGTCAQYGIHDRDFAPWSEEFQADYVTEAVKAVFQLKRITGLTIWQMFDTKSYTRECGNASLRSKFRGYNCAGLLDEYRRPKLAFDAVAKLYRAHKATGKKTQRQPEPGSEFQNGNLAHQ